MKIVYLAVLLGSFCFGQKKINLEEISENINKKVMICDKIYGSHVVKSNGMTLLNVGNTYPNNLLTLAIFEKDLKNFSYNPSDSLTDRSVCVTGKLILYKGKPEIILKSEKDLEIINENQSNSG